MHRYPQSFAPSPLSQLLYFNFTTKITMLPVIGFENKTVKVAKVIEH